MKDFIIEGDITARGIQFTTLGKFVNLEPERNCYSEEKTVYLNSVGKI